MDSIYPIVMIAWWLMAYDSFLPVKLSWNLISELMHFYPAV